MRRSTPLPLEALQPYLLRGIADCGLRIADCESEIRTTPSAICNPQSADCNPQSAIRNPQSAIPLEWQTVFGNDHPVEIEVGFGKGLFLLTAAALRPEVNFLGLEIERKYQLFTANRVAKRQLGNIRLACADARLFLPRVASASVQALYVFFPDPWWKQRHRKRRLFTVEFAEQCGRILRPGGLLHLLSDVAEYFAQIVTLLTRQPRLQPLPPPPQKAADHDADYLTNFERKYRLAGRPIHRGVFRAGSFG